MSESSRAPGAQQPVQAVEVYSCPKSPIVAIVRFLGPIEGLLTHYTGKGSVPCGLPGYCEPKTHRSRLIWKGYASVLRWRDGDHQHWMRSVLEITEAFGEQLEGRKLRGEEWELQRVKDDRGYEIVQGTYSQALSVSGWPEADKLEPILKRFYRVSALDLGVKNPLDRRTLVTPRHDSPPRRITESAAEASRAPEPVARPRLSTRAAPISAPSPLAEILSRVMPTDGQPNGNSTSNGTHKTPQR